VKIVSVEFRLLAVAQVANRKEHSNVAFNYVCSGIMLGDRQRGLAVALAGTLAVSPDALCVR
jgi:hypothetical protein